MPAWWKVLTIVLNSPTWWPRVPLLAYRTSGAKKPMELYPQ